MRGLIAILTIVLFMACRQVNTKPFVTGMENKSMLNFNILLPDSSTYFNTINIKSGKKTLLFYYSPTCPYCRAQMREIVNHISRYKNVQLCVITGSDFRGMKSFNEYFKLEKYPEIITGIDTGDVLIKKYKAYSVPFTAIFDEDKRLISAYRGRITGRTLLKMALPQR